MNTLLEFIRASGVITAILLAWLWVQQGWRRTFPEFTSPEDDVLAGRGGCRDCKCAAPCEHRLRSETHRQRGENDAVA
jgi:hypothetical protein